MKPFSFVLGILSVLFILLLSTKTALAVCGTYIIGEDRCFNVDTNEDIEGFTICQGASVAGVFTPCCSTDTECPFQAPDDEDEGDDDDEDTTQPYPESSSDCGRWVSDPVYGPLCFGDNAMSEIISNPEQCPLQGECCRATSLCTKYYGCILNQNGVPTGGCEERYTGPGLGIDIDSCELACQPSEPDEDTASQVSLGCGGHRRVPLPGYVNTAIGCIPFNIISNTARFFLAWGLSVGGGVALLLIGISALMFATSSGNPDKLGSAKDLFWAALTGLGMLILSVFLLRFIGVDVLGLFS
jgi:hypothetical protein